MKAFDKIIGYDTIKNELIQICDMIKNREIYAKMGAKLPSGILLYGNPELERYLYRAKEIILNKKDYIKRTVDALIEKETLLASDISKIWEICP